MKNNLEPINTPEHLSALVQCIIEFIDLILTSHKNIVLVFSYLKLYAICLKYFTRPHKRVINNRIKI